MHLKLHAELMSHSCPKTGEEVLTILPPLRKELGKYVPVNLNREIHKMETLLTQKWDGQEAPSLPLPSTWECNVKFSDTNLGDVAKNTLKDWVFVVGVYLNQKTSSRFIRDRSGETAGDYVAISTTAPVVRTWLECRVVPTDIDHDWRDLAPLLEQWAI